MRTPVVISIALAGLLVIGSVTPAFAGQSTHISDGEYLTAARCAGIAEGLGADTKPYEMVLDIQSANRPNFVMDAAENARSDGARLARRSDTKAKTEVAIERDGVCKAYAS